MPVLANSGEATPATPTAPAADVHQLSSQEARLENFFNSNLDLFPKAEAAPERPALTEPEATVTNAQTPAPATTQAVTPEPATEPSYDDKLTKSYLKADKERHLAKQMAKSAQDKAKAYETLMKATQSEDPTEVLKAAGIDTSEYLQKLLHFAQKDLTKPVDPVTQTLNQKLKEYEERDAKRAAEVEQMKTNWQVAQQINTNVLPVIATNTDRFETLLAMHKGSAQDVAQYVFNTAAQVYNETGKAQSFDAIADALEKHHFDLIENGHKAALQLKKFSAKYGSQPQAQQTAHTETPAVKVTETPRPQSVATTQSTVPSIPRNVYVPPTQEDRIAEAFSKAGLSKF